MVKRIVIYSMLFFLIVCIVYGFVAAAIQQNMSEMKENEIVNSETMLLGTEKRILSEEINSIIDDLQFCKYVLEKYGFNDGEYGKVEDLWKEFSGDKKIYDQIRYIDADGFEKIRINYAEGGAVSVDTFGLQNKKDRYYFTDTMALRDGQVYISKIDLNIENGVIEQPIKPMIRICTPIFDKQGKPLGIVAVNYYAKYMLENFDSIAATHYGEMYLLNADGYWISNSDKNRHEWAFMYEDRQDEKFQAFFPDEWKEMNQAQSGTVNSENGYFVYTHIVPLNDNTGNIVLGEGDWIAVSYISTQTAAKEQVFLTFGQSLLFVLKTQPVVFIAIFIISVLVSILMAVNKRSKDDIRYFSEYDTMTGMLNRRAGLTLLSKLYRHAEKTGGVLSVCFMDVNGLKEVNDNLGHEMGDELLVTVAQCIKSSIRHTDYMVRLGGDEFLLILPNDGKDAAEKTWQRIKGTFDNINDTEGRTYIISVSHGISEYHFNSSEPIDRILNTADKLMYTEKAEIKKELNVLKKAAT